MIVKKNTIRIQRKKRKKTFQSIYILKWTKRGYPRGMDHEKGAPIIPHLYFFLFFFKNCLFMSDFGRLKT